MTENLSKEKTELFDHLIKSLGLALTNNALYPPNHPALNSSTESFKGLLNKWLITEEKVELDISPNNILLNGALVKENSNLYSEVADYLHKKGLIAVSFTKGIDMTELLQFFSSLKIGSKVVSEKDDIAKNIGTTPHITIKQVDYSSLLTSAKTVAAIDEKGIWQFLSSTGKELKNGRLPKSKAEFMTTFLNDPKKAAAILNTIYKEALAKLDEQSTAEEIRDVFSEMNKYFEKYSAASAGNTKKALADIMSNLDPGFVISLFKDKGAEDGIPNLADELFKGSSDDMVADFMASLMRSGNKINEKMIKLFNRLVPGKDKYDSILPMVTDKLFKEKLLSRDTLSVLQNSIKDLFESHPDDDFITQIYNLTVEAFLDKDKGGKPGPGRYSALANEYNEFLKKDNLKKEKIRLLLNILWLENDAVRFKKASDILVSSFQEILAPQYTRTIKEVFEFLAEKLSPAQMSDNAIAQAVSNMFDNIGSGETIDKLISFIPGSDRKVLDDIAYVLINTKEYSAGRLLDIFMKEGDVVNRGKFGYVLSRFDGKIAKEIVSRIDAAISSPLFPIVNELYKILKITDFREAQIMARILIKNKNIQIRSWALEEFSPDSIEEKNIMFEILEKENNQEIKKKLLVALIRTKDGEIAKKLFERLGKGFFKNKFLLYLIVLCGTFKVDGSLAYLKRILERRPFVNTKAVRALRVESVLSLARIGTPEAMESIRKSADDPDKSVRAMCKMVLGSRKIADEKAT